MMMGRSIASRLLRRPHRDAIITFFQKQRKNWEAILFDRCSLELIATHPFAMFLMPFYLSTEK